MAVKIFLTGVTGYIGGDIFYALQEAHPDFDYTLLVRSEERATPVKAKYPKAKFVYGDLNSSEVIEKAASEADIVIHTANSADDVPSAQAIAKGLAAGHTPSKPGFWLHICGTGILMHRDMREQRYGQPPYADEKYDDVADIDKVLSLPDEAIHRNVDKIVLAASAESGGAVRTAIVGPPCISGAGRGPVNTRSIQVYNMIEFAMKEGYVPVIGTGRTEWDHIHVNDLAALFVRLVDAAQDPKLASSSEIFGDHGYYFCEAGSFAWGDVAKWIADELVKQGFMAEPKVEETTVEYVAKLGFYAGATWGLNSKSFAKRARQYLGWKPTKGGLKEIIPNAVSSEAVRMGIEPQAA
ncbi:hypothetical protein N0V93_003280 [Gnomoniopsis smithogilvyi]|uniref:NAD(P)-binding domain-containing protein n=1 Tax=Gnomoniopsis smithogilvyi TaxID=1191159 RepID=A0A9W9CZW0_9PEZI|nr:hypothetical protein N0V93_003280 [Gnomoniopsis smithogilvyi]